MTQMGKVIHTSLTLYDDDREQEALILATCEDGSIWAKKGRGFFEILHNPRTVEPVNLKTLKDSMAMFTAIDDIDTACDVYQPDLTNPYVKYVTARIRQIRKELEK